MKRNYKKFITQSPILSKNTYIAPQATVIGAVTLGNDVSIWPGAVIRADMHTIAIGDRSNIQDNSVLHVTHSSHFYPDGFFFTNW